MFAIVIKGLANPRKVFIDSCSECASCTVNTKRYGEVPHVRRDYYNQTSYNIYSIFLFSRFLTLNLIITIESKSN